MNYGPLGDPGSYGTARSMIPEGKVTPIEYPQAMPFSGRMGAGGVSLHGSDPWLNTMDRIDRERYEGEAEARDYYLNRQRAGTVWDAPKPWRRIEQVPTLSRPRPVDTQGSLGNYQWNKPAPITRYGSPHGR